MKEDNTIFVLQRAIRYFKIRVTDGTIKRFLLSHPYYPTLKSVCDALKKWKVDYYPLELNTEEIRKLEIPFIAHLKTAGGLLVFVEKITDQVSYIAYPGRIRKESYHTFAEKLSGAVILMEKNGYSGEQDYVQKRHNEILDRALFPLAIITVLSFLLLSSFLSHGGSISQSSSLGLELLVTNITGLSACIFLTMKEFKIQNLFSDKICGFNSKTDCDTVLSSDASRFFGWANWADVGLIYFTGTLLFLFGIRENASFGILALVSAFSLPYPVFSIYYQSVKLKKWCPFCLIVQLVLIAEFVILLPALNEIPFNDINILKFLISFSAPAVFWLLFKARHKKSRELQQEQISYLRIKRDPLIFHFLITQSDYTEFPKLTSELVLGNLNAQVTLTAFLSLYCGPCAQAFKQLKSLLENSSDIKIHAVFSPYNDEETLKLINIIYYLHEFGGSKATTDFLYRWYSTEKASRKAVSDSIILPENFNKAEQVRAENTNLFEKYQVEGTPTIYVNGYKFPKQYEYQDIGYYIDDIKKFMMESKRQEAHYN
ncbi:MAG: vitamin K epoxide reductase family protein [Prolixibacteraceae bacterium]